MKKKEIPIQVWKDKIGLVFIYYYPDSKRLWLEVGFNTACVNLRVDISSFWIDICEFMNYKKIIMENKCSKTVSGNHSFVKMGGKYLQCEFCCINDDRDIKVKKSL